jgi:DNA adenine methylase
MKPFLKWVGGKTEILEDLFISFPENINNYYEPFIGGGSVLIELLNKINKNEIKVNNFFISDYNENLINLYNTIKNNPNELLEILQNIKDIYLKLDDKTFPKRTKFVFNKMKFDKLKNIKGLSKYIDINNINETELSKVEFYYYKRYIYNLDNINIIEKSALFIFLNKTCFRGLHRVDKNGLFNVPYGNYKKLSMFDKNNILELSNNFNKYNINFIHKSFDYLFDKEFTNKDYIYFDPPYYPEDEKSFVSYNKDGFGIENNEKLIKLCNLLDKNKVKFLLSNSDTEYIMKNYSNFVIYDIECSRNINSKNTSAKTLELLIEN